ncbi:MAG: HisA/HisF-related TIM barrel protein [Mesorhizobium sp.]
MRIIPVLDLKGGVVVRARAGRRGEYLPIETPLSSSAEPVAVVEGLLSLYPFDTFYCADLDAIGGALPNQRALDALAVMPNPPTIWLDAGYNKAGELEVMLSKPNIRTVLGTESQGDAGLLSKFTGHPSLILSLDFFADGYYGPHEILDDTTHWPQTIIVMTLARVGVGAGPDIERLEQIKSRAGSRTIVAAGGVRHADDVKALALIGVDAVLVATALHDGRLTPAQLADFQG